ncbi:hypothetical protein [Methylobacterium sp. CM6244]
MKRSAYTAALFAAFNALDDTLLGHCTQHHRHGTLNLFLNNIQGFFWGLTRRRL